jgi:nucleotide-binding universal stress UspA family protein
MIAKILVPQDGTEITNKAFEKAIEFAKAFNAEILLLHVIQDIPIPASLLLGNDRALISKAKRSIAKELEKGWNKMVQEKIIDVFIHKDDKIEVRSEVTVRSSSDEEIITFAEVMKLPSLHQWLCNHFLSQILIVG